MGSKPIGEIHLLHIIQATSMLVTDVGDEMGQSTFGTSNFGTNLLTSAPNVNFGTEFHWNVNFGIMQKDNMCRS